MTADQRVTTARAYLAGIRKHNAADLPFSVLLREAAELRRQLGQVLDAVDGMVTITAADVPAVMGALADAATLLERRAGQWCGSCETSPAGCCDQHLDDLDAATRYKSLALALAGPR